MNLTSIGILLFAIAAVVVAYIALFPAPSECLTTPAEQMNIGRHLNLQLHDHAVLNIIIDDKAMMIPQNIGILPGVMRPIHTHDEPNELHIEAPCERTFTLGEFFRIWNNQTFNSSCIFSFCNDGNKSVRLYVNGEQNDLYDRLPLNDDDVIEIVYG